MWVVGDGLVDTTQPGVAAHVAAFLCDANSNFDMYSTSKIQVTWNLRTRREKTDQILGSWNLNHPPRHDMAGYYWQADTGKSRFADGFST